MATPQPLFGLVPAGLPVMTIPTEVPSPTSFLYAVSSAPIPATGKPFSHMVVFLLPGVALPPNTAAAIYLVTQPPAPLPQGALPNFRFLGGIGPGKESVVFKISPSIGAPEAPLVIGISIESAELVAGRIGESSLATATGETGIGGQLIPASSIPEKSNDPQNTLLLAQRIIKNAFNFLASHAAPAGQVEVVPLKAFEEWWRKFETRIQADPSFLERGDV